MVGTLSQSDCRGQIGVHVGVCIEVLHRGACRVCVGVHIGVHVGVHIGVCVGVHVGEHLGVHIGVCIGVRMIYKHEPACVILTLFNRSIFDMDQTCYRHSSL